MPRHPPYALNNLTTIFIDEFRDLNVLLKYNTTLTLSSFQRTKSERMISQNQVKRQFKSLLCETFSKYLQTPKVSYGFLFYDFKTP